MTEKISDPAEHAEGGGTSRGPDLGTPRRFDVTPAHGRRAFYSRLEFIRVMLLALGVFAVVMAGYTEWLALQPLPRPTLVLPTLDVPRVSPTPTPTTAVLQTRPTSLSPVGSGSATAEAALTATSARARTPTPAQTRPPTPAPTPTAPPASPTAYPAPTLLEPEDGITPLRRVVFRWQWTGPPLPELYAFDLRIWSDREQRAGATKRGAVAATKETWVEVDLPYVPAIRDFGAGDYYWTVVVVDLGTGGAPQVVGAWGESRRFVYR